LALAKNESRIGRDKVGATFAKLTALYRLDKIPDLRHSTRQKNEYLLSAFVESKWGYEIIPDVLPLKVVQRLKDLTGVKFDPPKHVSAPTKAGIRSVMSQCFELAVLHEYLRSEMRPVVLRRVQGCGGCTSLPSKRYGACEWMPEPASR